MDSLRKSSKPQPLPREYHAMPIGYDVVLYPQERTDTPISHQVSRRVLKRMSKQNTFHWGRIRGVLIILLCFLGLYAYVAWRSSERLLQLGNTGYGHVLDAAKAFQAERFDEAEEDFVAADADFTAAKPYMRLFPGYLVDTLRFIPGLSKASSGRNALLAGGYIAHVGREVSVLAQTVTAPDSDVSPSLLTRFQSAQGTLDIAASDLEQARIVLDKVNVLDIPEVRREKFVQARELLPTAISALTTIHDRERIVTELLGGNGPRKYLFLFQNNHELRATGGFIGSYAVLNVHDGIIEKPKVDGIFNPDGQLKENIVPPKPIQKISAAWSLHDSNWYPDFPTSAQKAMFFYEKTGGPTVDGVVTITPTVMEKLLSVIGPIDMPEYGVTIDADTFIPIVQEQVEEKYDKTENAPKQILADLSTQVFERILSLREYRDVLKVADTLVSGLNERHILLYAENPEAEAVLDRAGWSGRLLKTDRDFVSVVHSNINGYKTDGVVTESLSHHVEIAVDGSLTDTLVITRKHTGGHTPYEWWNKVNADYLRVYVPLGSTLISVKGTTWEFPPDPLDYTALAFRRDADVEAEEKNTSIDAGSGTRISQENDKTVFGAWVYVSPGESVTVEMVYKLPFTLDVAKIRQGEAERFSVLYQKQSGSLGSALQSDITFPEHWKSVWQTGGDLVSYGRRISFQGDLAVDHFIGTAFTHE